MRGETRDCRFRASEIGELADLVADDEVQIPERMEKSAQKPLLVRADRPFEEDEESTSE